MKTAVLVAFGDELLSGIRSEKNCSWLASKFHDAGWKVKAIEIVEDSQDSIIRILRKWTGSTDIIITSGGLGPTHDDRTRDAIAQYLGCSLKFDRTAYDRIVERYSGSLRDVVAASADPQGYIPERAYPVHNEEGSALGIKFTEKGTTVYAFPGVPAEFISMARSELGELLKPSDCWRSVHVVGWAESILKNEISDIISSPELHVSILPSPSLIEIVLRGPAEKIKEAESAIREILPSDCLPHEVKRIEDAVMKAALDKNLTFSGAESCTGGLLGAKLTEIAGISRVFMGSAVCYSNSSKTAVLGVPEHIIEEHGAVSGECASAMARGSRKAYKTDYAVSITGIAGPDGGTPEKPVGTVWFGLSGPHGEKAFLKNLPGHRDMIRLRAVRFALELLWREMK